MIGWLRDIDGPKGTPGDVPERVKALIDTSRWQVLRLRMAEGERQMMIDRSQSKCDNNTRPHTETKG